MRQTLRPYQDNGIHKVLDAYAEGARSVLFILPTGGGKTTVFCAQIEELVKQGKRCLILVHRRELATQAANRLREFGIDFGYIMSDEPPKPYAPVQIATVQTLIRRNMPRADFIVCDEAHLSTANTWQTILGGYPNARVLGATATPWRLSGKPLADQYDASVVVSTPAQLREMGFLSPYNGFSYKTPDLTAVKTVGGEYNEGQAAAAMSDSAIVNNVVQEWLTYAKELSTVVFAVTVEHSQLLTKEFIAAGVRAEHIDGNTPKMQRDAILQRVDAGITRVLCNVGIAVEGLDIPRLKCCVLARPTKSLSRAIQMMGRVRRPWNGITARIHDHAFVIKQHGLPDIERDYSLSGKPDEPPALSTCKICMAMYVGPECPSCGVKTPREEFESMGPNFIEATEKVEFSSGDAEVPREARPPVEIKWVAIGKKIEGIYEKKWSETTQYGVQTVYLLKGDKRDYRFFGTSHLNSLMSKAKTGLRTEVTFVGQQVIGDRTRKTFSVSQENL